MRLISLGLKPQGFTARVDKVIERPADIDGCDLFAIVDGQVGVIQRFGTFGSDGSDGRGQVWRETLAEQ